MILYRVAKRRFGLDSDALLNVVLFCRRNPLVIFVVVCWLNLYCRPSLLALYRMVCWHCTTVYCLLVLYNVVEWCVYLMWWREPSNIGESECGQISLPLLPPLITNKPWMNFLYLLRRPQKFNWELMVELNLILYSKARQRWAQIWCQSQILCWQRGKRPKKIEGKIVLFPLYITLNLSGCTFTWK